MTDRYAVWGNPIAHSQSPWIHAEFARRSQQDMVYEALLGDLDQFEDQVRDRIHQGYLGFNVTLPFKTRAMHVATHVSTSAELAEASNTLVVTARGVEAHNTDGVGLLNDLERLGVPLDHVSLLILGAGGATRGILEPLLQRGAQITLTNRTLAKAQSIVERFNSANLGIPLTCIEWDQLATLQPQVILNATSTGLSGVPLPLPASIWRSVSWAYDLAYSASGETAFTEQAQANGVMNRADGLGMLVEQAAEAFLLWRGVRPETNSVREALRVHLQASRRPA